MVTAPASLAALMVGNEPPLSVRNQLVKSTLPVNMLIGGMMMSATSDATMVPNAAPMMMPTAMSITLPRIANSLNSFSITDPPLIRWMGRGPAGLQPGGEN